MKNKILTVIVASLFVVAAFLNFNLIYSNGRSDTSLSFLIARAIDWRECDGADDDGVDYGWTWADCPCSDGTTVSRDVCGYCGACCDVSAQQFCSDVCN